MKEFSIQNSGWVVRGLPPSAFRFNMNFQRSFIYDPSLALYLPLWKLDGSQFMSRDAYGHLVTRYGALWRPDGHSFDGVDDYLVSSSLPIPTGTPFGPFTVIGIVKYISLPNADYNSFYSQYDPATANLIFQFHINTTDSKFKFECRNSVGGSYNNLSSNTALSLNTWYHLACSYDGSTVRFYLNGNPDGSSAITPSGTWNYTEMRVSSTKAGASSWYSNNVVAEIFAYTRGFSATEPLNHYLHSKRSLPWW